MSFLQTTSQYGLALHTTSPQLGLCISNFSDNTRHQTWNLERELSNYLHPHLAEFIKLQTWSDLAFIAVARGPGSFTSTRIGVVTARTLAQQLDIPLFAISTLATLAWSEIERSSLTTAIAIQMEATRGQLYGGVYEKSSSDGELVIHVPDRIVTPEAWQETLERLEIPYYLINAPTHLGSTATSLLKLAERDWRQGKHPHWSDALPFYGT
jgi:tRNA threonylcarbamoyladenosine biosynthesis protein TsaB